MAKAPQTKATTEIRRRVLDRCFGNFNRKYDIQDLLGACNTELELKGYNSIGINMLRKDIERFRNLISNVGNRNIEIKYNREGNKSYYRYTEEGYSYYNLPLAEDQIEMLVQITNLLKNFTDSPQFDWAGEMIIRLQDLTDSQTSLKQIIEFEQNIDYKGLKHISTLYNHIVNKTVLSIKYTEGFKKETLKNIHPYYLKQYNSRWFLFGLNHNTDTIYNLALDRIKAIEEANLEYKENDVDFHIDYFYDIVGVTNRNDREIEDIEIKVLNPKTLEYIRSKPIHPTQRINGYTITYKLKSNYEFESLLFTYANNLKIIKPLSLKKAMEKRARAILRNNK